MEKILKKIYLEKICKYVKQNIQIQAIIYIYIYEKIKAEYMYGIYVLYIFIKNLIVNLLLIY